MQRKAFVICVVLLISVIALLWVFLPQRPKFVVYGYQKEYNKSYFLIYGAASGSELTRIEDRYFIRLKPVQDFGVSRVKDNLTTSNYIHYFLDMDKEYSVYQKDKFASNGIHFFEDTVLGQNASTGIISFYIGDTAYNFNYDEHIAIRDSIVKTLKLNLDGI